jgi:hypothetical protein
MTGSMHGRRSGAGKASAKVTVLVPLRAAALWR